MEVMTDAVIDAITIESVSDLKRTCNFHLSFADMEPEIDKRLRQLQPRVSMHGFRKGKVPLVMVKQQHGEQVFFEVANDKIMQSVTAIVQRKKLDMAGNPEIVPERLKLGEDVRCNLYFEVFPEVHLADLKDLKLEQQQSEITDEDVDVFLLYLRRKGAKDFTEISADTAEGTKVVAGDEVKLVYEIKPADSDKVLDKVENTFIVDPWSGLPEPVCQALPGMKTGDAKEVQEVMPADYPVQDIAGKTLVYNIQLMSCRRPILPELNQEFFASLNIKDTDEAGFRNKLKLQMQTGLKDKLEQENKAAVFAALSKVYTFAVPEVLVQQEAEHERTQFMQQMQARFNLPQNKMDKSLLPLDSFLDSARKKVRLSLVMQQYVKEYKITLDAQKVEDYIAEKSEFYEQPEAFKEMYQRDKKAREKLSNLILEHQIIDFIVERADVTYTPKSYFAMMKSA